MADSQVSFLPIPRFVEVQDDRAASPKSNEMDAAISPREAEDKTLSDERIDSLALVSAHQRNESRDSIVSSNMQPVSSVLLEQPFLSELPSCMDHNDIGAPATTRVSFV